MSIPLEDQEMGVLKTPAQVSSAAAGSRRLSDNKDRDALVRLGKLPVLKVRYSFRQPLLQNSLDPVGEEFRGFQLTRGNSGILE